MAAVVVGRRYLRLQASKHPGLHSHLQHSCKDQNQLQIFWTKIPTFWAATYHDRKFEPIWIIKIFSNLLLRTWNNWQEMFQVFLCSARDIRRINILFRKCRIINPVSFRVNCKRYWMIFYRRKIMMIIMVLIILKTEIIIIGCQKKVKKIIKIIRALPTLIYLQIRINHQGHLPTTPPMMSTKPQTP